MLLNKIPISKTFLGVRSFSTQSADLGKFRIPIIKNENILNYLPGSVERARLKEACENLRKNAPISIPAIVNGLFILF